MSMERRVLVILIGLTALGVAGCGFGSTASVRQSPVSPDTRSEPTPHPGEPDIPSIAPVTPTADEYERLGDTYVRQGNWTLALLQYDHALKAAPRHTRVRYKKYLLYLANGLSADAIAGFRSLVEDDPGNARAWEGLGRAFFQAGQEQQAKEALRHAVQENSALWRAHSLLGMLYERGHDYVHAVSAYRTALELNPDRVELRNNLGRVYFLMGDYRRAVEEFESAKARGYSVATLHNNLGLALAKTGAYREALASFRLGGTEPHALYNIGILYLEAGRAADAAVCFQKAIDANPQFDRRANEQLAVAQSVLRSEQPRQVRRPRPGENVCS
jgi:Flp pilus assembly protein TadD